MTVPARIDYDAPVSIQTATGVVGVTAAMILETIAPNAPKNEAYKFLLKCQAGGFNPLTGEVSLLALKGGRYELFIDIAGWLRKLQENPHYDGHECGVVISRKGENDVTKYIELPGADYGEPGPTNPYMLVGGWARVYMKNRSRPVYVRLSMYAYGKESWGRNAAWMMVKCALAAAVRQSIPVHFYDPGERDDDGDEQVTVIATVPRPVTPPDILARIRESLQILDVPEDHPNILDRVRNRGFEGVDCMQAEAAEELAQRLESLAADQAIAAEQDNPPEVPAGADAVGDVVDAEVESITESGQ